MKQQFGREGINPSPTCVFVGAGFIPAPPASKFCERLPPELIRLRNGPRHLGVEVGSAMGAWPRKLSVKPDRKTATQIPRKPVVPILVSIYEKERVCDE